MYNHFHLESSSLHLSFSSSAAMLETKSIWYVDVHSADTSGAAAVANRNREALCGSGRLSPCCVKDGCCQHYLVLLFCRALRPQQGQEQ